MNRLFSLTMLSLLFLLAPATSQAGSKFLIFGWPESHWRNLDFKPYLENSQQTHDSQWQGKAWVPADWIYQRNNDGLQLIDGFYRADIIRNQSIDDGVPVLEVGPAFYRLGGEDKRRVAATLDEVFKITSGRENGIYTIKDWKSGKPVGMYSAYGLQLQ